MDASEKTFDFSRVIIVGLGLLGGSVGLAIRQNSDAGKIAKRLVGLDAFADHARQALEIGIVEETAADYREALAGLENDESGPVLIVIAVPVGAIPDEMKKAVSAILALPAAAREERLLIVTNTASVQAGMIPRSVENASPHIAVIGSHPIAGSELSGPSAASAGLFAGKRIILTAGGEEEFLHAEEGGKSGREEGIRLLERFWRRLGGVILRLPAPLHDRILARTSHFPHWLSFLLADGAIETDEDFCGTGWRGMTRLAESSPEVWADIFTANRLAVLNAADDFEELWKEWKTVLEKGDRQEIINLLKRAKSRRNALGS